MESVKVSLALLADAANVSEEGKLNILGIFDSIQVTSLPFQLPHMVFVMRFEYSPAEAGHEKDMEVVLTNQDGKVMGRLPGELKLPTLIAPGMAYDDIVPLDGVIFPEEGDYVFTIMENQHTLCEVPVKIILTGGDVEDNK